MFFHTRARLSVRLPAVGAGMQTLPEKGSAEECESAQTQKSKSLRMLPPLPPPPPSDRSSSSSDSLRISSSEALPPRETGGSSLPLEPAPTLIGGSLSDPDASESSPSSPPSMLPTAPAAGGIQILAPAPFLFFLFSPSFSSSSPRSSLHSSSRRRFCILFRARSFSSIRSFSSLLSISRAYSR